MKWYRVALRAYGFAGQVARLILRPVLKLRLGEKTLGKRIDLGVRKLISPAIRAPNPVKVQGHVMWYIQGDVFHEDYLTLDNYEPETTTLVKTLSRPGMTFVDLGAFVGYYTLLAARQVDDSGHVYAFEPSPYTIEILKRNIAANGYDGRVTVVPKAISNDVGKRRFFLPKVHRSMSNLYTGNVTDGSFIEVDTTSVDAFFSGVGWPHVDLVKMDVEGAEKAALFGMAELSRRNPDLKLIVEFAPKVMKGAGVSPEEFFAALRVVQFNSFRLIEHQHNRLEIPRDIPRLMQMAGDEAVNLLCEKGDHSKV